MRKKRSLGAAMRQAQGSHDPHLLQPSLLRSLSRPSEPQQLPVWAARVRERLAVLEAQMRRLEREKQMLLDQLCGAPADLVETVLLEGERTGLGDQRAELDAFAAEGERDTKSASSSSAPLWSAAQGLPTKQLSSCCDGRAVHPALSLGSAALSSARDSCQDDVMDVVQQRCSQGEKASDGPWIHVQEPTRGCRPDKALSMSSSDKDPAQAELLTAATIDAAATTAAPAAASPKAAAAEDETARATKPITARALARELWKAATTLEVERRSDQMATSTSSGSVSAGYPVTEAASDAPAEASPHSSKAAAGLPGSTLHAEGMLVDKSSLSATPSPVRARGTPPKSPTRARLSLLDAEDQDIEPPGTPPTACDESPASTYEDKEGKPVTPPWGSPPGANRSTSRSRSPHRQAMAQRSPSPASTVLVTSGDEDSPSPAQSSCQGWDEEPPVQKLRAEIPPVQIKPPKPSEVSVGQLRRAPSRRWRKDVLRAVAEPLAALSDADSGGTPAIASLQRDAPSHPEDAPPSLEDAASPLRDLPSPLQETPPLQDAPSPRQDPPPCQDSPLPDGIGLLERLRWRQSRRRSSGSEAEDMRPLVPVADVQEAAALAESSTSEPAVPASAQGGASSQVDESRLCIKPEACCEDELRDWMWFFGMKPTQSTEFMVKRLHEIDIYLNGGGNALPAPRAGAAQASSINPAKSAPHLPAQSLKEKGMAIDRPGRVAAESPPASAASPQHSPDVQGGAATSSRAAKASARAAEQEQLLADTIRKDKELYERFLLFEPVEISELRERLAAQEPELRNLGEQRLRKFLDAQGVVFASSWSSQSREGSQRRRF
eukprot:TRINITY_DN23468_c0_g1_i1.p1 TRINITY_DN23468_c0_g1~~TRINITY_DN23468_c0_g1_i1.p1  ORF type:complete len:834 (+),score=182.06 TRINITY_DN23468_c0_g1_i1:84-2585(+)